MGVYAVSPYGVGVYGPISPTEFAAELRVRPLEYDRLLLWWDPPPGDWSDIRLVRSSYGFPMSATSDWVPLVDAEKASAPTSFLDTNLQPGRFYYYTLFVFSVGDGRWIPAGTAMGLVTQDHGYHDLFWSRTPLVYREADEDRDGILSRFLNLFSYQLDRIRTGIETLRNVANIDQVSGTLLPPLAESLGVPYEPELGMRTTRGLVKNAIHLAKTKGTKPGIEGVASAYTDFGATAVVGRNLLLDGVSSTWAEPDVGTWEAVANCSLDTFGPDEYTAAVADTGTLRIVTDGAGDAVVVSGTFSEGTLVPVQPSTDYVASVHVKTDGTGRTETVSLAYYDAAGDVVGTFDGAVTITTGTWVRREVAGTSPASAVWAAVRVTIDDPMDTEEHLLSAPQIEAGTVVTDWESARMIHVYLEPRRTNLVPNPSFEVDADGWAGDNATIEQTTDEAYDVLTSTGSLRLTTTAAGDAAAHTSDQIPTTPGEPYTLTAFFLPGVAATGRLVRVAISWYTDVTLHSTSVGAAVQEVTGEWTRASVTALAPAGTNGARLVATVEDSATGEIHYLDAVLFEQTEFVKEYFDAGMFPPSDYLWAGAVHASASHSYPRRMLKDERLLAVLPNHIPTGVGIMTHYGETAPASAV